MVTDCTQQLTKAKDVCFNNGQWTRHQFLLLFRQLPLSSSVNPYSSYSRESHFISISALKHKNRYVAHTKMINHITHCWPTLAVFQNFICSVYNAHNTRMFIWLLNACLVTTHNAPYTERNISQVRNEIKHNWNCGVH
jgi:predicted double-glycine peptidase